MNNQNLMKVMKSKFGIVSRKIDVNGCEMFAFPSTLWTTHLRELMGDFVDTVFVLGYSEDILDRCSSYQDFDNRNGLDYQQCILIRFTHGNEVLVQAHDYEDPTLSFSKVEGDKG